MAFQIKIDGEEGLVLTVGIDGEEKDLLFSVQMLRDIIRATYQAYGDGSPNNLGYPPTLELVHSGVAQAVGTIDSQLILNTVQMATIVVSSDEIGLQNLRDQIDKVLALRGGSKAVQ